MGHKDYMRIALKSLDPMLETGPTIFATSITFSWLIAILSEQQVLRLMQYNRFKNILFRNMEWALIIYIILIIRSTA